VGGIFRNLPANVNWESSFYEQLTEHGVWSVAELASDPCDERLGAFIAAVEGLLGEKKGKL
jgi:hypothetical protein